MSSGTILVIFCCVLFFIIRKRSKTYSKVGSDAVKQQPIMLAKGSTGQLELYETKIRIRRRGFTNLVLHGLKGNKDILLESISSIQFKKAGFTAGYIQFAFMGGQEAQRGVWQAVSDENTILFNSWHQQEFIKIHEAIEQHIVMVRAKPGSGSSSGLADLEKLADLKVKGIITDDEFMAKKRQLLGI